MFEGKCRDYHCGFERIIILNRDLGRLSKMGNTFSGPRVGLGLWMEELGAAPCGLPGP